MPAISLSSSDVDALVEDLAKFAHDPLAFTLWAFPWGEKESFLADIAGPSPWQAQILSDLRDRLINPAQAIRLATKGGKGGGKSALLAWIILWAFSTCKETRGRVTANTRTQLETITWAEVGKWFNAFIAKDLFEITATALYPKEKQFEKTWRVDATPWSKENPDAFRGLHNYGKRIIIVTDEASGIDDIIAEALDGAMTDTNTEIIWIAASNPSRKYGWFYECFAPGKRSAQWNTYTVDTTKIPFTNKLEIAQWAKAWGENSDYYRVNVLGEFPNVSSLQLIPSDAIADARIRVVNSYPHEPLIFGLDVARFGDNESVLVRRRGDDARTMPALRWRGLPLDQLADKVGAIIASDQPDAVFVDEGGVGGGVVDFLNRLGHRVTGINFGSPPGNYPDGTLVANKRAEMYVMLRNWLVRSGCIEDIDLLAEQLTATEYGFNKNDAILLEAKEAMRKRGVASPDWSDGLALTFALPVAKRTWRSGSSMKFEYDPFLPANEDKPRITRYSELLHG